MEEKDFQRIEDMMTRMMGQFRSEIGQELSRFRGEIDEDFRHQSGCSGKTSSTSLTLFNGRPPHLLEWYAEGFARLKDRLEQQLKEA